MPSVLIFYPERCQPLMSPTSSMAFDSVVLSAGTNELTSNAIELIQKHPDYARFAKLKAIEIIEKSEVVDLQTNSDITDLSAYAIEQAQTIINSTSDLDTLDSWLKSETRQKVRATIATRITQVKSGSL